MYDSCRPCCWVLLWPVIPEQRQLLLRGELGVEGPSRHDLGAELGGRREHAMKPLRCMRGGGTMAHRRAMRSMGVSTIASVPSRQGFLKASRNRPSASAVRRSCESGGRAAP